MNPGRLDAAAGHGGKFRKGHAKGRRADILAVYDDDAVGGRLNAADTLKAAAAGHGVFQDGVERDLVERAVGETVDRLVDILPGSQVLIQDDVLCDDLARTVGIQLTGGLGVQPGDGAAEAEALRRDDADMGRREGLAEDAGVKQSTLSSVRERMRASRLS